jgi:two-component system, NarL family, nitrate/nitrite response regulator NarL
MTNPQPHGEGLSSAARTNVLVSEASKMYCDLLSMAFAAVRDRFHVVATASSTAEILAAVQEYRPQVVIVSDRLQDGPLAGIRMLPEIRKIHPATRILVLMGDPHRESVIEAFRLGADGVFCRNSPFDLLWKSLEAISQGEIWANAAELRYVLDEFKKAPKPRKMDPLVERRMTKREVDVTRWAIEGFSNREIARKLGLAEHTVKNYLFKIFDKLGVSNRVELVLSCLRQEEAAQKEAVVHLALGTSQFGAPNNMATRAALPQ